MEYVSSKEMAERWGISRRRVQQLCEQGSVDGVKRLGRSWMIPEKAPKPVDARKLRYLQKR